VKPYPCCGHAFAVIDAVLRLRAEGLRAADVRQLDVHTYRTALQVAGIADPRTGPERKFSIPYLAAAALLTGEVGDTSTAPDPAELRRLMDTVRLHPDPAFEAAFPARRGARVSVVTHEGVTLAAEVPDRSGSPQNPLSDDQVEQKFLATSAAAVAGHGPEILRQVKRLRHGGTVVDLSLFRATMAHRLPGSGSSSRPRTAGS
jgi:2-methylcitrate dehydratase PrpD